MNLTLKICLPALTVCLLAGLSTGYAGENQLDAQGMTAMVEAVRPGLVQVEYTLQYDKGEEPTNTGWGHRCANCGGFHSYFEGESLIKQKRPAVLCGYLLTETKVLLDDPIIHPRFIKSIEVRIGNRLIKAKPAAYFKNENGLILELAEPATDCKPLVFDPSKPGPYYGVDYDLSNAQWNTTVTSVSSNFTITADGRKFNMVEGGLLIVDSKGTPVGISTYGELPFDGSWKGSPLDWPAYTPEEYANKLKAMESAVESGLLQVTLNFRSPKADNESRYSWRDDDDENATEIHAAGLLIKSSELLILSNLANQQTARLETIQVKLPDGETTVAKFGTSLREYGCFTATLEKPLPNPMPLYTGDITRLRKEMLFTTTYQFYGDTPIKRYQHCRISGFELGYESKVFPSMGWSSEYLFVFTPENKLACIPLMRRKLVKDDDDYWSSDSADQTPVQYVLDHVADLKEYGDPNNAPVSEIEENRIAWLGVEMQDLDEELATINNVSKITRNGEIGAIVSFVYPESPAAKLGIEMGDILINLHHADHYRPIPIDTGDSSGFGYNFPWDRLDNIPEEYFSEIPKPWPTAQNTLNRKLTSLGFGETVELEYCRDGEVKKASFEIVESPAHYDSAKRYKSEDLGITVRDLTYEVRRFFHLKADDPGVIVSKIEPGSKASVAGLRPYEIITLLNDQPVTDADTFKAQLESQGSELRLTVKRMTRTRVVKVNQEQDKEN